MEETALKTTIPISELIKMAFPSGTQFHYSDEQIQQHKEAGTLWEFPPNWPPDMFGIAAFLLNQTGAYHHITPGGESISLDDNVELLITSIERDEICNAAINWANDPDIPYDKIPEIAKTHWKILLEATNSICGIPFDDELAPKKPKWWVAAVKLLSLADQTCSLFPHLAGQQITTRDHWVGDLVEIIFDDEETVDEEEQLLKPTNDIHTLDHTLVTEGIFSICQMANRDMFCVLPKALTPSIGCTIRSMSQNLSLLPAAGVMQAGWLGTTARNSHTPKEFPLRCLMIPFPYEIQPEWFKVSGSKKHWKWFELEQNWLPVTQQEKELFLNFIDALIKKAEEKAPIHTLVFPEYSLNWETHELLVEHVLKKHETVNFVISGSSSNCEETNGNFVLTTQISKSITENDNVSSARTTSRSKHHRWRIDREQIESYKLSKGFKTDAETDYFWEKIHIPRRRIHINVFRSQCILSTLICEDLARSEPCHQYLRALGPNIVFTLLMDGPQLPHRWPSRCALELAEDPGSAVMTLTSRALVSLSNKYNIETGKHPESWSIALWRDNFSSPKTLSCPLTEEAIVVEFQGERTHEVTLDGRNDKRGWSMRLKDTHIPISLNRNEHKSLLDKFVRTYETTPN